MTTFRIHLPGDDLFSIKWLTDTLRSLIAIESVNPAYGGPTGGEHRVLEWASEWLRARGLRTALIENAGHPPVLRARIEGQSPGPGLLFETHIDTVSVLGMAIEPFGGKVEGGRLWGRGATDAKGQAAAMMHAMAAWAAGDTRPPRAVELALVCDEEYAMTGARALVAAGVEAAGIVVGEPTGLRVVSAHKGVVRFDLEVRGRAAHAARPALGANAILGAARIMRRIEEDYLPSLSGRGSGLLGPPTMNVAKIEGGLQPNLVPERCRVHLERRLLPEETAQQVREELEAVAAAALAGTRGLISHLEGPLLELAPLGTDPAGPLARAAGEAARSVGRDARPIGVDYATDASILGQLGVPIVVAGPGSIDQAHTTDEFIELDELVAGARFYADLMGREGWDA